MTGVADPSYVSGERELLLGFVQRNRDLVAWKVSGVDEQVFQAVSTTSGLTAHGVVNHLLNVERHWYRDIFAGQDGLTYDWNDDDGDGEFHLSAEITMPTLLAEYAAEAARCDEIIAAAHLDDVAARVGREGRPYSLRWILLHMIEETSRHLGHLDLLREQADQSVGYGPPKQES